MFGYVLDSRLQYHQYWLLQRYNSSLSTFKGLTHFYKNCHYVSVGCLLLEMGKVAGYIWYCLEKHDSLAVAMETALTEEDEAITQRCDNLKFVSPTAIQHQSLNIYNIFYKHSDMQWHKLTFCLMDCNFVMVHMDSFACKSFFWRWQILSKWTVCWPVKAVDHKHFAAAWTWCVLTVWLHSETAEGWLACSLGSDLFHVYIYLKPDRTSIPKHVSYFGAFSRGKKGQVAIVSPVTPHCKCRCLCFAFLTLLASLSLSLSLCVCLCLGSQCLALAPGPTHTSAPLPTLWTRCLKSWGGSASYAWEKEMSCVAKRSHSELGPRRFLRSVSWAHTLWAWLGSYFLCHKGTLCSNGDSLQAVLPVSVTPLCFSVLFFCFCTDLASFHT